MNKIYTIISICLLAFSLNAKAQEATGQLENIETNLYPWQFKINAGYNIGGTIPIPFPAEIRKIEEYHPAWFSPHLAAEVTHWFNDKWGVSAQVTFDYKGFDVIDSVWNLRTEMKVTEEGTKAGVFTGRNTTEINNFYATIPIMATYRPSKKWFIQLGLYGAYLFSPSFKAQPLSGYFREGDPTGEITIITEGSVDGQDFSEDQRKFDWGALAAGEWMFSKRFAIRGQFSYSIASLFPSDFTAVSFGMHNVYGTLGVSYTVGRVR